MFEHGILPWPQVTRRKLPLGGFLMAPNGSFPPGIVGVDMQWLNDLNFLGDYVFSRENKPFTPFFFRVLDG